MNDGVGMFLVFTLLLVMTIGFVAFTDSLGGGFSGLIIGTAILWGGIGLVSLIRNRKSKD
jgi:hypothetical protein